MPYGRQMVVTLITLALAVVLAACGGSGGADGPVIMEDELTDPVRIVIDVLRR